MKMVKWCLGLILGILALMLLFKFIIYPAVMIIAWLI